MQISGPQKADEGKAHRVFITSLRVFNEYESANSLEWKPKKMIIQEDTRDTEFVNAVCIHQFKFKVGEANTDCIWMTIHWTGAEDQPR